MEKGKRRKKPVKLFQAKRIISFILSILMVFGNVANNVSIAYASDAVYDSKRTPDSVFVLDRDEIQEAALAAIEGEEVFDSSALLFTEGTKSSLSSKYKKLFGGNGASVYEFDPNYSGEKIADGTDLRTFVRVDGDKKEIIFLFVNYTIEDMNLQINVSGYTSDVVTVESTTERVAGEQDIVVKEEETQPEETQPEGTTESQPQEPGTEESVQPSESTEESQAPTSEETTAVEENTTEAESTEQTETPEETTEEITTEAQTPEETAEEITEEETTTVEETEEIQETEEEVVPEEESEEASASLEDNVAEEPEGDLVAMSIHNVPRVATSLEGLTEPVEETTEAVEEEEKQEPEAAEPTTAEPIVTEPATAEPSAPEETTEAAEQTEEESEEGTIITIDEPETSAPEETEPTVENENQNVIPEDDKILSEDVLIEDEDAVAAYGSLKGGKVYGLVELDETYTARAFVISLDRLMEQTAPEEDALIPETPSALTPAEDTVIEAEVADGSISIRIEIPADLGITVDHAVAVPVDTEPFQELVEDSGKEGMQLQDMKAYDILLYDEEGNEIHELDGKVNVIFEGLDAELADSESVSVYYLESLPMNKYYRSTNLPDYKISEMQDSDTDGESSVTFRTNHFSTYVVTFWKYSDEAVELKLVTKDIETGKEIGNIYDDDFADIYRWLGVKLSTESLADAVMENNSLLGDYEYKVTLTSGEYSSYKKPVDEIIVKDSGKIKYRLHGEMSWKDLTGKTLYLWFEKQQTKITYHSNNGDNDTYKLGVEGGTITMPTLETTGFENGRRQFLGWASERTEHSQLIQPGEEIEASAASNDYYAVWSYLATFKANGGNGSDYYVSESNGQFVMPTAQEAGFSKSNQAFLGWSEERYNRTNVIQPGAQVNANDDVTYYAVWSYTATFKANGGAGSDYYVPEGQDGGVIMPKLEDTGFANGRRQFMGWSVSANKRSDLIQPGTTVALERDTVYYAIWSYEAVFKANGGSGSDYYLAENEEGMFIMPDQTAAGFTYGSKTLLGWSKSSTDRTNLFLPGEAVKASDTNYYAVWSYNVIFNANTGSGSKTFEKAFESGKLVMPTQEETAFTNGERALLGWSTRASNRDNLIAPGAVISVNTDTIYYAIWSYQATFYPNVGEGGYLEDGKLAHQIAISANGTVELPSGSSIGLKNRNDKKVFAGWVVGKADATDVYGPEITYSGLKKDTYFYARWIDTEITGSVKAQYYVRKDGVIQAEPSQYDEASYFPKSPGMAGTIKVAMRVNNDFEAVEANLGKVPTDATIQAAAQKAGYKFDPDTQYVRWYVIKVSSGAWHVDGVIQEKSKHSVIYHPNKGTDYFPDIVQYKAGEEVTVNYSKLPTRNGYEFAGWDRDPDSSYPEYPLPESGQKAPTFVMPDEDVDLYAIWKPSNNTRITVEHYWQKTTADLAETSDDFEYYESKPAYATTGATVYDADYKIDYQGLTYQEGIVDGRSSEEVDAEGTTVLRLYYTRNQNTNYLVEHYLQDLDGNTYSLKDAVSGYGITGRDAVYSPNAYTGFEYDPNATRFYSRQGSSDREVNAASILADGSLVIKLYYVREENIGYTVEYYYQENGVYPDGPKFTDQSRSGAFDETVNVTADDMVPALDNYVFDNSAANVLSGTISETGLVLKVYFKPVFTVTYKAGLHGTFDDDVHTSIPYGSTTPEFAGTLSGEAGYTFDRWEPAVDETVTSDAVYIAIWSPESVSYHVEYYYQNQGTYSQTADFKSDDRFALTGTTGMVTPEDLISAKDGYVFDEDAVTLNVLHGTVAGDGSLVLKVYFKQQFTVTYDPGTHGTFTAETTEHLDYNAATPEFKGQTTGKAGYTFDGWLPVIADRVTEDAVYKAQWKANENTSYKVEYYYQSEGAYAGTTEDYKERTGTTDSVANVIADDKKPVKSGYVFDAAAANVLTGTIAGDGSLVLKVYFKQQFTVTYNPGRHGTFDVQKTENIDYGTATPEFTGETSGELGYKFAGWDKTIAADVKEDAVYTALWTPEEGIKYTVEYYYQTNGSYSTQADISDPRTGTTEDVVSVSDDDKDPKRNGYVFDTAANNVLSGTITGDGKLVLKVYFKQQFTVTYKRGDHGTFTTQLTEHLDYNVQTPAFKGQITGEAGYTFDGWKPVIEETVKADAVYVAQWKAEDTEYKVEYYYQNEGKYADTTTESVTRTGKTGTLAEVKADDLKPVKNGYAFDSAAANVLEGSIKGDKSLVLKVYFKQQFTVVYDPGTHGTFTAETTKYLDYNVLTPEFKGSTTGDPGYTFVGWEPAIEKNVKADATYVAQWAANEDTRYKVEYYYQADGQYTDQADDTDVRTGTTDTLAETTSDDLKPAKDGYAFDANAANVLTGNIEGDGSLVLKVYFKQQFTVTYKPGLHGTFTEQVTENLDYNAYTPDFIDVKEGADGYTFERWEPAVETRVKEDAEYVAVWTANTDTKYTVEYYYQENGVYGAPEKYVVRRGTTDTEAVLESGDKISEKSDYVYDTAASNVESGNIAGDGSLVLKVYFKQQFTVTYQPGTHGTFTAQGHSGLSYGDATPGFSGEITGKDGYEFGGWTPAVTDTVTQNAVYVATWNAKGSTNYSVEFYYQNQGAYPATANSVQQRSGRTDTTAAVTDADKTPAAGYILDTAASNVYEGIVAGNGSLVLRLYFKQQFTVTYEPGTNGTFATQITGGLSYNDKTPAFNGQTTGSGRYVFNGWNPVVAENVTGNAVYVAQWRYISSSSSGGGGGSSGGPNYNATGSSDGPGATVTVLPTEVPLANLPETDNGMTVIDDGEVPLAALPKTGNPSGTASWMLLLSSLLLAAYTMLGKKKEEEN